MHARSRRVRLAVTVASLVTHGPAVAHDETRSSGQRLYVPVYSEIPYGGGGSTYRLAATLSIRNTDPDSGIKILRADYYDSNGKRLQEYVEEAVSLGPLASQHVVVRESERRGGVGANFIVEWRSEEPVVPPLVEAVMIRTGSLQWITFLSDAVVIEELGPSSE